MADTTWSQEASKPGLYTFLTAGKYVDRNITLNIPDGEIDTSAAVSGSSYVTLSDSNNKISVTATGDTSVTNNGWVDSSDNDSATETKYITAIKVPKDIPFALTTEADTALDTTSNITITNNAYRQLAITNNANGDTNISGAGRTDFTVGSTTTGSLYATAYIDNGASTSSGSQTVISNGKWNYHSITPSTSAQGPFYGETKVSAVSDDVAKEKLGNGSYSVSTTPNSVTEATSSDYYVTAKASIDTAGYLSTGSKEDTFYIQAATTDTSSSGTLVDTITPSGSAQVVNITEGYTNAKYWSIGAVTSTIAKNILGKADFSKTDTTVSGTTATRGIFKTSKTGYTDAETTLLSAATFANTATSGVTYVDISNTTASPVLAAKDYLYINRGYVDNLKISLAKLVPDDATISITDTNKCNQMLSGYTAYNNDGVLLTGTIADSSISGSDNSATASATLTTSDLTSGTYTTTSTSGYTHYITTSASVGTVSASKTATAGYLASDTTVTASVTGASKSETVYLKDSTFTDGSTSTTATASANAYASTSNLASGTYTSASTTGYTYHVDSSASASDSGATATAKGTAGYLAADKTATAKVTGASKSATATTYLLDSTSSATVGSELTLGTTLTIGKGYYPTDRTYTVPSGSGALDTTTVTETLTLGTAPSGYTNPTLVTSQASGSTYITLNANATGYTTGKVLSGVTTPATQYMEVYTGTYSIT